VLFAESVRKIARRWLRLLKESKLLFMLVAAELAINAQCDQDRIWSAFERQRAVRYANHYFGCPVHAWVTSLRQSWINTCKNLKF
jgi:hypothetical protein